MGYEREGRPSLDFPRSNGRSAFPRGIEPQKVLISIEMIYLRPLGRAAERLRHFFKPLVSVQRWLAERPWVNDPAEVLVHEFRDEVQIPINESLIPFVDEFDLGGVDAL